MDGADFQAKLRIGKIGEGYIARWFRAKGYHVLPVYEKEIDEGKGPVLFQAEGTPLVAPDMVIFNGDEKMFWIEAKTKSAFTWHRITKRWVTGIDLHHYEQYLDVAALSPWPVWLMFLQLNGTAKDTPLGMVSPTGLFGGELENLSRNENHRHPRSGMVYWAHDTLRKLAELGELGIDT